MSYFKFPAKRLEYAGIENPRFVSDIVAANELLLDGLVAITGLNATDFAIIAGMDYTAGTPGNYTEGVIYLKGNFYYSAAISEGLYLKPNLVLTESHPFTDGNSRSIYELLQSITTSSSDSTTTPLFTGSMSSYRLGLKTINTNIQTILVTLATLKQGAFRDVGNATGTLADGGILQGLINNVLQLNNSTPFVPVGNYNPATKLYVDQNSAKRIAAGNYVVGDITDPTNGTGYNIAIGSTLPDANYIVMITINAGGPTTTIADATVLTPVIYNKTTTSFSVWLREGTSSIQHINLDWVLFHV
jgi:hypothetical protein